MVDPGDIATGHLNLITAYVYDANDNLVAKIDPNGNATANPDDNVTRYIYNEANEQVYVIDAGGGVIQTWHDADGRVTETRRYATALTPTQLSGLGMKPSIAQVVAQVAASTNDQVTYTVYNNDGQQAYTIDPLGYVTATRYDAAGRVSETLAYANALSASTLASLQASLQQGMALSSMAGQVSAAANTDQNAHAMLNLYDADGHVRFVVQQDIWRRRPPAAGRGSPPPPIPTCTTRSGGGLRSTRIRRGRPPTRSGHSPTMPKGRFCSGATAAPPVAPSPRRALTAPNTTPTSTASRSRRWTRPAASMCCRG